MADSILPFIPEIMEQINNDTGNTDNKIEPLGIDFKFDFENKRLVIENGDLVKLTSIESVKQWITLILNTCKDQYDVYVDTDFYCNIADLIGMSMNTYVEAELIREITEAMLVHRYIKSVDNMTIIQDPGTDKLTITYSITLIDDSELSDTTTL